MSEQHTQSRRKRVEIFCLTYGEPSEHRFVDQFAYSLSILNRLTRRVAPIPRFITPLLAARRGLIRVHTFRERGYNSPLEKISQAQAEKVQQFLSQMRPSIDFHARMVMEFRPPYIWKHLAELAADPPDELILLPLYMAESDFTAGISRTDLTRYHREHGARNPLPSPAYVSGFGFDERLGSVLAEFIANNCRANGWDDARCAQSALILGAHGTLQFPPAGINSGARETLYLFGLIRKHLKDRFRTVRVGWLNHKIGGKWTFPAVDESAGECWEQGIRNVVYFPFGFMGDNAESQCEGKDALASFQWEQLLYLPCPNDNNAFCRFLAEKTLERLDEPMREEWDQLEQGGRRDLIQKERPARRGEPGILSFNGPALAVMGIAFWFLVGAMLMVRGVHQFEKAHDAPPALLLSCVAAALLIGFYKGLYILGKLMRNNLRRLRGIPQPSPLHLLFSKPTYFIIAFFMALGISLRFTGIHPAIYGAILAGVGLALVFGAVIGVLHYRESVPRQIISLNGSTLRPREN